MPFIGSRLAGIPSDHVVAELASFPLATEEALRLGITRLHPELDRAGQQPTRKLWRAAESAMLRSFPGFSVDEAIAIRDQLWFGSHSAGPQPLHRYLERLARAFLEPRGSCAVPIPRQGFWSAGMEPVRDLPALARRSWRWMSFALPPDLLLSALGSPEELPTRVDGLSPRLALHLKDHGFAEVHLHGAAGIDYSLLWAGLAAQIADPQTGAGAFRSPGATCGEGGYLGEWLLRGALARFILAAFLARGANRGDLASYLGGTLPSLLDRSSRGLLHIAFGELRTGRIGEGEGREEHELYPHLQSLYRHFAGVALRRWNLGQHPPAGLEDLYSLDPVSEFFPVRGEGAATPEMQLLSHSLAYLRVCEAKPDALFAELFWQSVRVRSIFYRYVVQRPMIPGLQWFLRHYERMREARRPLASRRLAASARSAGLGQGLRSLEYRTTPEGSLSSNLKLVLRLAKDLRSLLPREHGEPIELGIVFHFSRTKGKSSSQGAPGAFERGTNADPSRRWNRRVQNPTGYRFATYYREQRQYAIVLAGMIQRFPATLQLVRALDACTDELSVPTWVLAPLFRYIRRTADAAATRLSTSLGRTFPSLRMTVHAGEDFPHLLTGLRATDEAIRRFEIRSNDRIGHAIALGMDPEDWARKAGQVPVRRETRLLDLAWEWSWASREGVLAGGRHRQVEREMARLSELVFGKPVQPYELERLIEDLHDESELRAVGFCDGLPVMPELEPWSSRHLLLRYLTDQSLFQCGQEIEWVDPSAESAVLTDIQASVRQKLGARGIAVEVNPSSNLLIGDFTDLTRHPLWRLYPPKASAGASPVSICIGSDDPLTFATCLPEEYQFVFDALLLAGLSDEEALDWVDRVRRSGLEHRFTNAGAPDDLLGSLLPLSPADEIPFPP